jgi:hypothetical protein
VGFGHLHDHWSPHHASSFTLLHEGVTLQKEQACAPSFARELSVFSLSLLLLRAQVWVTHLTSAAAVDGEPTTERPVISGKLSV